METVRSLQYSVFGNFQKWKQLLAAWNIPFLATSKNGNNFQKWKQLLAP